MSSGGGVYVRVPNDTYTIPAPWDSRRVTVLPLRMARMRSPAASRMTVCLIHWGPLGMPDRRPQYSGSQSRSSSDRSSMSLIPAIGIE